MKLTQRIAFPLLAALIAACTARDRPQDDHEAATKFDLTSDRARASYMVGVDIANDLRPIRDDVDLDIVQQSMRATLSGQKPQLDAKQLDEVRREFTAQLREKRAKQARAIAERNRRTGEAFLAWAQNDPISAQTVVKMYDALKAAGNNPEAHVYTAGGHGFGMKQQGLSSDHWIDAFHGWLTAQGFAKAAATAQR